MSYKQGKLINIIKEFDVDGSKYIINGIDTKNAIFFARRNQEMYEEIPLGNYTITTEENNTYLNIVNEEYLSTIERIQVGIEFSSISSKYEVDFNVDINVLTQNYNKVVDDVKNIFAYIKKTNMIADGLDVSVVLPQLDTNEVWVKTEDGYKGLNITSLEENIQGFFKDFYKLREELFKELDNTRNSYIAEIEEYGNMKKDEIQSVLDSAIEGAQAVLFIKGDNGFVYNLGIDDNGFLFSRKTNSQDNPSELIIKKGNERYKLRIDVNGFLYTIKED